MSHSAPNPIASEALQAAPAAPAAALTSLASLLGRAAAREWLRHPPGPVSTGEPKAGTPASPEAGR